LVGQFAHTFIGLYLEYTQLEYGGLGEVDDLVYARDSVVQVFSIHWGGERGVKNPDIAILQIIRTVFQVANLLCDFRVTSFQERLENLHGFQGQIALLVNQPIKVGHPGENPIYQT
jgi:hypothetical protein